MNQTAVLSLLALLVSPLRAGDIAVPLGDGKLLIRDVRFIALRSGQTVPELYFKIENHTNMPWWEIQLNFTISGTCNNQNRKWVIPASLNVGYSEEHVVGNVYQETYDPLEGKVEGCRADAIIADLDVAMNQQRRIAGPGRSKIEAAAAARQKRLATERRQAEANADVRRTEERRKVRAACDMTYQNTAHK